MTTEGVASQMTRSNQTLAIALAVEIGQVIATEDIDLHGTPRQLYRQFLAKRRN